MTVHHDPAEIERKLRHAAKSTRAGMLGIVGGQPRHFQPMRPYLVEDEKPLWFISRRDTQLIEDLQGSSHAAMFVLVSEDHHLHACIGGTLVEDRDQARLDLFWNSVAEAWLPEGKTSPEVTLLRFDPVEAEVWLSDNSFKLAYEVARAVYNRTEAESGEKATLRFG
jgi:general stress protein 26